MFVLRVEMYKLCSAIYRTTLFTTLTSTLTLYFIQYIGHVVKHGLDSISKTWTLLVKHGLY